MKLFLSMNMALLAVSIGFTLYVLKKYGEAGWKDIISRAILPPFLLGVEIAVLSAIEYTFIMQDGKGPFLGINLFMFLFFSSISFLLFSFCISSLCTSSLCVISFCLTCSSCSNS